MITLQSLFVILVILLLCYLVINGLITRSVWVKGARRGAYSFRQWVHKRNRDDEPGSYWFAMSFYVVAVLLSLWLLVSGSITWS